MYYFIYNALLAAPPKLCVLDQRSDRTIFPTNLLYLTAGDRRIGAARGGEVFGLVKEILRYPFLNIKFCCAMLLA